MTRWQVEADPYPWPIEPLAVSQTALIVIDMQRDFCAPDGYVAQLGEDIAPLRAALGPAAAALSAARAAGMRVFHTRQGYRPDLSDMPAWRRKQGTIVGQAGPLGRVLIRGEPGFQIVPEVAPREDEPVIDKTASGAFTDTDLDRVLRTAGVQALAFAGLTIDVCVHTTLREAKDRGYQCLLVEDACGAINPFLHDWAIQSVKVEGGVFGSVTDSAGFIKGVQTRA